MSVGFSCGSVTLLNVLAAEDVVGAIVTSFVMSLKLFLEPDLSLITALSSLLALLDTEDVIDGSLIFSPFSDNDLPVVKSLLCSGK